MLNRVIPKLWKRTSINYILKLTLTYNTDTWALSNTNKSQIQAMNMKLLICAEGKARGDRNQILKEELEFKAC